MDSSICLEGTENSQNSSIAVEVGGIFESSHVISELGKTLYTVQLMATGQEMAIK